MVDLNAPYDLLKRFVNDRGGNFAIMTALLAVPLIISAGVAVDYSSAYVERTNLQQIADGAALAGGKVFDGTNLAAAQTEAVKFITAYASTTPASLSYTMTGTSDRVFQVALNGAVPTSLMKIGNVNSVNIAVTSQATAPAKPTIVTLTPTQAQGWYYKIVTIRVVRPGATAETILGTVTYQPTTHNNSGQGTMTVTPSGSITLGDYTKLVLQMDIKYDGCGLKKVAKIGSDASVSCSTTSASSSSKFDLTLRTDDPSTSNYLFVNGSELPQGVIIPIENYFGCQAPQKHAWEDGGGWATQDIFYTISSTCISADGDAVRLTQ
ncbi:MAG: TadE/TadG family type IV pilus assembly protein [Rhizobium sp.]